MSNLPNNTKAQDSNQDKSLNSTSSNGDKSLIHSQRDSGQVNIETEIRELIYTSTEKIENYEQQR
jgi:hypothetical protein